MAETIDTLKRALAAGYRVEREIGQGGMATVFLATDLKHDRPVAIKVLRPELAAYLGPERFLREIEIAAKLQHPHILPVYDSGRADGVLYYVMPFVAGESLRDRLARTGPVPPADAVRIAREVADALDYAHRHGVVHRDVKPANILLSEGHAVVADFGIARALTASAVGGGGLTQAGMTVGTPAYMSPEQALGDSGVDGRTDVYALGIVLYEMLKGAPPYEGTTPQSVIMQAMSGKVPELANDTLGCQPVIERALAREPKDRFATAGDLVAALDTLATGVGFRAPALSRRRRRVLAAAAIFVGVAIGFALWGRMQWSLAEENPRQSLIIFPFENKSGDPSREFLGEAAMNLLGLAAAHWADLRVYDDERTASLIRRRKSSPDAPLDFEEARGMAREARVGTLVLGDFRREGDSLAIEAKVHDVRSGNRLATHLVRAGWQADPRSLFDGLAARILGTSGAPPGERPSVITQTTSSIEAYRAYLAGTAALQRFQIDSAILHLERAVALDTGFALAYLRLRDANGWSPSRQVDGRPQGREYILAAERHSASLPPRLRQLVAFHRAYQDAVEQGWNQRRAREIVTEMIERDSTDVEAWYQLGEAHYHGGAHRFPHSDTLGNLGRALRAFQRTLALDSTYALAYRHILDALAGCAAAPYLVCLADSAVYGPAPELARRVGAEAIERLRSEARAAQIATARGWVTAVPGTPQPHLQLLRVLYTAGRYDEALAEADAAASLGESRRALLWRGLIAFQRGRPRHAAALLDSAFRNVADTVTVFAGLEGLPGDPYRNFVVPGAVLAGGGGRLAAATRLLQSLMRRLPVDSVPGPGGLLMAMSDLKRFPLLHYRAEAWDSGSAVLAREVNMMVEQRAGRDSVRLRQLTTAFGEASLQAYLASRDTTLLVTFLRHADTTTAATWRVADGLLALSRGDTVRARLRVDRHYRSPASGELTGDQGLLRAYAWADLLAGLGQWQAALAAFSMLDTAQARIVHPGLLVRSYAERGAVYQELGDTARAAEHYQKFISAWEHADPELQPRVTEVRRALAALRGEIVPTRPR